MEKAIKGDTHKSWYIEKFGRQLDELYKLMDTASEEQFVSILNTINQIESLIFGETELGYLSRTSTYERLDDENDFINYYKQFIPLVGPISLEDWFDFRPMYASIPKLSDDEFFGLIHDFYKRALDRELFHTFRAMFKKREKFVHLRYLRNRYLEPDSFYLQFYRHVHIRLKRRNRIKDISDMAHEYGHGMQYLTNYDSMFYEENEIFAEIVSIFFELLCLDYLKGIDEFRDASILSQADFFDDTSTNAGIFLIETDVLDFWDKMHNSRAIKIMNEILMVAMVGSSLETFDVKALLDMYPSCEFKYTIGYIIAVELFMEYTKDRDKGFYLLKKLMAIDWRLPKEEYFRRIEDLGINLNSSLDDYKKHIISPNKSNFW